MAAAADDVSFPGGADFAPTRVTVACAGDARVRRRQRIAIRARATAELSPGAGGALPGERRPRGRIRRTARVPPG